MEPKQVTRQGDAWIIDPKYTTIQFSATLLYFLTVKGSFSEVSGTIERDPDDISNSSVDATIMARSISTGNRRRDAHLLSGDFLNVEEHPAIRFKSTRVEKGRDRDTLRIAGVLTIAGQSREVVLDVNEYDRSHSPQGEEVGYYAALKEIDRFDFGISRQRGLIGRKLKVMIQVQALRRTQRPAYR